MSEYMSCRGSVAREVVGVKGFRANLHLMQLWQSHFLVILGESVIVGEISQALRLTSANRRCHNTWLSALRRDACPVG